MGILKGWLAQEHAELGSSTLVCSPSGFEIAKVIGRRSAEAKAIILAAGLRFRVVGENGHRFVMPVDDRIDRVLLEIEADIVIDATIM
jgi:hypothetical protein